MLITLENQHFSLTADTLGAQIMSIRDTKGCEYLWQGDARYWPDRAPTLFPFIGRIWQDSYCYQGTPYQMGIHGFAAHSEFSVVEQGDHHVILSLSANNETRGCYPFDFTLDITYRLVQRTLEITYHVRNHSGDTMPFGIGGHPGFRVPLEDGEHFEDYYLEFSTACRPDRVGFTPAVFLSSQDEPYALQDGKYLPLSHDLFNEDAVILKNMCREVSLRSKRSRKHITVSYPQMPYLGIWHWPHTDAPYVCIEPWSSLPARQDVVEEFSCKSDLVHLLPGCTYENTWTITIGEE